MMKPMSMLMLAASITGTSAALAEPVKPEVAAERVAACGFGAVRARFDRLLQMDVIHVGDATSATDEQLRCAARVALSAGLEILFPEPSGRKFQPILSELESAQGKAEAEAWLEERGLLARLPAYDPQRSDSAAFARTLETLCGPNAIGALRPMEGGATFNMEALPSGRRGDETLRCLSSAASVAGYPLGFAGNELGPQDIE